MLARLFGIALILISVPAGAADIFVRSDGWIVVKGPFTNNDGLLFKMVASTVKGPTTVEMQSEGGSAAAAILIGSEIKDRGYATIVQANKECVSACAFAWLAGKPRLMDQDARIGFHGVYIMQDGKPVVSGSANALMGSYLASIDMPPAAIMFATDARPETFNWIDAKKAHELGFDVFVLDKPKTGRESLLKELFKRAEQDEGAD